MGHRIVKDLYQEIQSINTIEVVGVGGVVGTTGMSFHQNYSYLDKQERDNPIMNEQQREEIQVVKEKDLEHEAKLNEISNILNNLNVLAKEQNEELRRQGGKVQAIDEKMNDTGFNVRRLVRKTDDTIRRT